MSTKRIAAPAAASSSACSSSVPIWAPASIRCWPIAPPAGRTSRSTASSRCTTTRASIRRWCPNGSNAAAAEEAEAAARMRVLIVKTSSMGDVVHALPVVHDMRRALPNLHIEWLVEASFAAIPRMHPGIDRVLPLNWRRWRRKLLNGDTWRAIGALRAQLREQAYDCVLDLQGLF